MPRGLLAAGASKPSLAAVHRQGAVVETPLMLCSLPLPLDGWRGFVVNEFHLAYPERGVCDILFPSGRSGLHCRLHACHNGHGGIVDGKGNHRVGHGLDECGPKALVEATHALMLDEGARAA